MHDIVIKHEQKTDWQVDTKTQTNTLMKKYECSFWRGSNGRENVMGKGGGGEWMFYIDCRREKMMCWWKGTGKITGYQVTDQNHVVTFTHQYTISINKNNLKKEEKKASIWVWTTYKHKHVVIIRSVIVQ